MLLFIGTSYCSRYWRASQQIRATADWSLYTDIRDQFSFLGKYSPVDRLRAPLRATYEKTGARALGNSDWEKAELLLTRAMDLGAAGPEISGKLALVRGYLALQQGQRDQARDRFLEAAREIPQSPDPHLGLARADLAASRSGDALAELAVAERLGYHLGPRELEQRTEAYRLRGFEELQAGNVAAARQDFAAAHIPFVQAQQKPRHKPRPRRWR
jgi:tetratricopeptide (TPR) repeat protein